MTNPALLMLIERLLWPVPRVRWEAARGLAHLIREGNREASRGLLNWIRARQLESEAVLGLGIIDAFDLGTYFDFPEVSKAISAPSHLSDWLLKRNFTDASGLSPIRYAVAPTEPPSLEQYQDAWFDRYLKWAVPPIFSIVLKQLQESTGFPFLKRWKHEWRWLQATRPRPAAEYPHFFSSGDRGRVGQFDQGQRELYVSAFLRMLAFTAIYKGMPHKHAEHFAMLALTMNRGLADLEPVERPNWAGNLLCCGEGSMKDLAEKLWLSAEAAAKPGEVPLALRVVDCDRNGFVEFNLRLTIGPSGFTDGPAEVEECDTLTANERPSEMVGLVGKEVRSCPLFIERPLDMTQSVQPEVIGRVHIELVSNVRLASPFVFGTSADIKCSPSEICLEAGTEVLSRWIHWYTNWEPTIFPDLGSTVSSMTTILKSCLDKLRASHGVEIARLVRVRRGVRRETFGKCEVETESYWV